MRAAPFLMLLALPACLPDPSADPGPALPTPAAPFAAPAAGDIAAADALLPVPSAAAPAGEMLGRVIVSPGNAGEPGLWLRTSRTARTAQGTVASADGASVDVVLIPTDGVSELSSEAYAALGLAPGSFAELAIYLR